MKIIMLKEQHAAVDGIRVKIYSEGSVYSVPRDLTEELAQIFLREKWAKEVHKNTKTKNSVVRKSLYSAPENKSA